ncbi:MAG: PQQ-binding-like beta-propeller repeat protein, partial [Sedimentisphaerales bacterium]|nr:PQQ-binding-like beta-propeller repeat protein [Sedimentisphaerales bacterium]
EARMRVPKSIALWVVSGFLAGMPTSVRGDNWPTYRHDNRRSGVTSDRLELPLTQAWEYVSRDYPKTAWAGPAKWDSYANIRKLKSMRNFDPVFYVTVAGQRVLFGSSADDAVHCLDVRTGQEMWVFFTEGPVRLPPSFHDDRLYFGSDDGFVYCIAADSGDLLWRYQASTEDRKVPVNGKLTSLSPCRTGVLVQDSKVYFATSLLPWENTFLCALEADSGAVVYRKPYDRLAAQGPMLASPTNLYISQGRQRPTVFERDSGRLLQSLGSSGFGGVFGLLTEDSLFVHGFGQNHRAEGELRFFGSEARDLLVTLPRATSIAIHNGVIYVHADGELQAFDRNTYVGLQDQIRSLQQQAKDLLAQKKKLGADAGDSDRRRFDAGIASAQEQITTLQAELPSAFLWREPTDCSLTLILAGETLFAGGDGKVAAYELDSGRQTWSTPVAGRAYGLAAANGNLLVSTDRGRIICFHDSTEK